MAKEVIAQFDTLSDAEDAVMVLDRKGFPLAQISVLAEGVEGGVPSQDAEDYVVVVEGDAQDASRAKEILQQAEARQVKVEEEA